MPAPIHGCLVAVSAERTDRPPTGRWLILAEDFLGRLAAEESLPEEDDGEEAGLELDIACSEIAHALVESGRSLKHLHVLRLASTEPSFRRGYRQGVRATALLCNALARDLPDGGSGPEAS